MKFSLHSVHGGVKNIDDIHQRARRAEELGYDGIFLGESHLSSIDSFQTLASCAMITKRLLLGIAVTNIVFRHPTVIAGAAASLNEISKGRAILGLGTGDGPVYSQGLKATPLKQFEEGVRLIRHLAQGQPVNFPSGQIGLGFTINQPAPIYVSAEGPKGLQLAGRCADGVILGTGFDLRVFDWAKGKIRDGTMEAARKESEVAIIAAGMLCVRDDGSEARKIVRNRIANRAHHNFRFTYETVPPEELDSVKKFMAGFDVMKPMEERVDPDLVNDYLVRRFSIAGTPKECVERIEELKAAGVEHLMLTPARKVYGETVEAFAAKVIPHFRG
ncbi:MAG: LLM class flavin-dependent oxidoreductase [Deltaproteobacteria bacterium]|nr:LLM class flavin-dependent oxidoreductase [Deltaproteobacteria bacterium]MDZ4344893.1 LLM class flavin-dependent oxidoreductase [Candidatus Binatia bacterium]